MDELLREAIAEYNDRLQERDRELQEAHDQNRQKQEKITAEIASLEQRLDALTQEQRRLEEQRMSVAEDHVVELLAVLTKGLKQSASSIVMAASFLLMRLRLVEEQAKLLESEPELTRQYDDYQTMEALRDSLPRSYLRFHEAVERRLAPYLRLRDQESGLRYDSPIYLLLMLAIDEAEGMAHWILPFPEESLFPEQGKSLLSDQIMETMTNAVAAVASGADWHLANIMPDLWWSGYPSLVASCKYTGEASADESAEAIMSEYFAKESLFQGCDLKVNVVEIGMEMWLRGVPGGRVAASEHSENKVAANAAAGDGYFAGGDEQSLVADDPLEV